MRLPPALRLVLITCPECRFRNPVDIASGARGRRCGKCGRALPWRPPPTLVAALLAGLFLAGCLGLVIAGIYRNAHVAARRAEVRRLVSEGRAEEAAARLPPRPRGATDQDLARSVAESLAAPLLLVDADHDASRERVSRAAALGDALVAAHAGGLEDEAEAHDDHAEEGLPELVAVLDAPLRRLQARRAGFEAVDAVRLRRIASVEDLRAAEAAVDDAVAAVAAAAPGASSAVARAARPVLDKAAIDLARRLAGSGRTRDASAVLSRRAAAPLPAASSDEARDAASGPDAESGKPARPEQQLAFVRDAVRDKDAARLAIAVTVRADETWPPSLAGAADDAVHTACLALASVAVNGARTATAPAERADRLLEAVTCDEVLPAEFLRQARRAIATARFDAAVAGAPVAPAVDAWTGIGGPDRSRALTALACLAERRGDASSALLAWSAAGPAALEGGLSCAHPSTPASADVPRLDYPSLPSRGSG